MGIPHGGIDFNVATGTQVVAIDGGTVVRASRHKAPTDPQNKSDFGNVVIIDHGNGIYSFYAHLSKFNVSVDGKPIPAGLRIGESGESGYAEGAHLHLSVLQIPDYINISATAESLFTLNTEHEDYKNLSDTEKAQVIVGTEGTYSLTNTLPSGQGIIPLPNLALFPTLVDNVPSDNTTQVHLIDNGVDNEWTFSSAIEYGQYKRNGVTKAETDWIKFSAIGGKEYFITVTGSDFNGISPLEDTFFTIRDKDSTEIKIGGTDTDDHDNINGKDAAISWSPDKSGDYFISVGAGGGQQALFPLFMEAMSLLLAALINQTFQLFCAQNVISTQEQQTKAFCFSIGFVKGIFRIRLMF